MKRRKGSKGIICLLTVLSISVSTAGCAKATQEEAVEDAIHVQAQLPQQGSLVLQNEFIGSVSPEEAVYVIPLVSAEVLSSKVEVGDVVAAGDVLCLLDSEAAQLQLESAQASYESAQANANSALGGQMELQDFQTANSISQLEKQLNDVNENLTDSKNDYEDTSNSLDEVSDWKDEAKEEFEKASEAYYTAEALYNQLRSMQSSLGGKPFAGMNLEQAANAAGGIIADYQGKKAAYEGAKQALDDYVANNGEDPVDPNYNNFKQAMDAAKQAMDDAYVEYEAALTAMGLKEAAKKAGISADDISQSGVSKLSGKMATAQSEYTNASTQKATLEAQKDGYDSAVDQLEDSLSSLEDNLNAARDTAAITENSIKPETQALMDAQLNAAGVGIKSAQMQLDMYTLTAPISGVIEAVNVTEHGFASSGNAAFVISNKETMTVNFTVSEAIRNTFSVGQSITVDRNGAIYPATITEIGTMVDTATGLFQIKASVEADGNTLLTGSSVKVTADTYRAEDVFLLPYDAVYYAGGQAYVYVAENGLVVRKNVETGIFNDTTIAVLSGITAKDQVITTWASNLREGVSVMLQEADTEVAE